MLFIFVRHFDYTFRHTFSSYEKREKVNMYGWEGETRMNKWRKVQLLLSFLTKSLRKVTHFRHKFSFFGQHEKRNTNRSKFFRGRPEKSQICNKCMFISSFFFDERNIVWRTRWVIDSGNKNFIFIALHFREIYFTCYVHTHQRKDDENHFPALVKCLLTKQLMK